jgi:bacteriocin-like protein
MEQDEKKRSDEEIKAEKEANDSELTDRDLENVSGGHFVTQPPPPNT